MHSGAEPHSAKSRLCYLALRSVKNLEAAVKMLNDQYEEVEKVKVDVSSLQSAKDSKAHGIPELLVSKFFLMPCLCCRDFIMLLVSELQNRFMSHAQNDSGCSRR